MQFQSSLSQFLLSRFVLKLSSVSLSGALLAATAVLLAPTAAQATRLESWRFDTRKNQLEFTTDSGVQPTAQLISDPTRLVIDLPGIALGRPALTEPVNGVVRSVRFGQFSRDTARVVVELAPGYTIDPNQVKFRGITAQRWVVSLPKPQPIPGVTPPPLDSLPPVTNTPPARSPVVISTAPIGSSTSGAVVIPTPGTPRPWVGSAPAIPPTAPSQLPSIAPVPTPMPFPQTRPPIGGLVVVIDPGHGGPDPGAIGIGGLQEKEVVLDISQKLASVLQQQGIRTVITRPDDRDLDLEPRVDIADQVNATLFVSVHANSIDASRPDVNGVETYYYQSGEELARMIHSSVVQITGAPDRGVRTARFYVLRNTSMPSVLVEVGFVTGRDDAAKLSTPTYRNQMADAIARGILQYFQRTAQR